MATEVADTGGVNASFAETLDDYVTGLVVPCIGLFGVVGNFLNLGILSWRSWRRDDDTMEKVGSVKNKFHTNLYFGKLGKVVKIGRAEKIFQLDAFINFVKDT